MRWIGHVLSAVAATCAFCWSAPGAARADEVLQFDAPVAPVTLDGTFHAQVGSGRSAVPATLTLAIAEDGTVAGQLTFGGRTFVLSGRQSVRGRTATMSLTGNDGAGTTVRLPLTARNGLALGTLTSAPRIAGLPKRAAFIADVEGARPIVVRTSLTLTTGADGTITGTGTASVCGAVAVPVSVQGTTDRLAEPPPRRSRASLTVTCDGFEWRGHGDVSSDGYVMSWKARAKGASGRGRRLALAPPVAGTSPGTLVLEPPASRRFNPSNADVVVRVVDAALSANPYDLAVTRNGGPVGGAVLVEGRGRRIRLPRTALADGRNRFEFAGKDSCGFDLAGTVDVWCGTHPLVIGVRDSAGAPVAGANVEVTLGDAPEVKATGRTKSGGSVTFPNLPDWTVLVRATGPGNEAALVPVIGSAGEVTVTLSGFDAPSPIDNNDLSTGDASGWNAGTSPVTVEPHVEDGGPAPEGVAAEDPGPQAPEPDWDIVLKTSGQGTQYLTRTFATAPGTLSVRMRYRFVTLEVPGGWFGSKYNDGFSVLIRSLHGHAMVFEQNTMNGLGLAAFDANGATAWREVDLPVTWSGDIVQIDLSVTNVADGLFDSWVIVDGIWESGADLVVKFPSRRLLERNWFAIHTPSGPAPVGTGFRIEIRRASGSTWYLLAAEKEVNAYVQRVAGRFRLRGKVTIGGVEHTTPERNLVVRFPTSKSMVSAPVAEPAIWQAWHRTLDATTPSTRREEGFHLLLDTNPGSEGYRQSPSVLGPVVGPGDEGPVVLVKPADVPADPTPVGSAVYVVARFHTHTPTRWRRVGRHTGPSGQDWGDARLDGLPAIVADYVGNPPGWAPAGHPLETWAKMYRYWLPARPIPGDLYLLAQPPAAPEQRADAGSSRER